MEIAGATGCTIRFVPNDEDSDISLSTFAFMIEESVEGDNYIASDDYVSLAQYQYLLNIINHKTIDFQVFKGSQEYYFTRTYTQKPFYDIQGDGSIEYILDDNENYIGVNFTTTLDDETLVVFYFRG